MRSSRGDVGQLSLWDSDPVSPPGKTSTVRRREQPGRPPLVSEDQFVSRGWPVGTLLYPRAAARAARGELAVVRDGDDVLVGFWGLDLGRPALFTDHGSTWLGERAKVVGVVTAVELPLSL